MTRAAGGLLLSVFLVLGSSASVHAGDTAWEPSEGPSIGVVAALATDSSASEMAYAGTRTIGA